MRLLVIWMALCVFCGPVSRAAAGSILDRVKAAGVVRCASVARPGLAEADGRGGFTGLEVDICRAVAAAVLGSPGRISYHIFVSPKDFDAVKNQQDDLFFFTGSEIARHRLAGRLVPGPTVFVESHAVMVPSDSPVQHVRDLSGDSICFMIGSPVERSLSAYFDRIHRKWLPRAFSEQGEMVDAYFAQNSHAIAGEVTTLAMIRTRHGVNVQTSRILPERLAVFPVMAATGTGDGQWSAIVAWTVFTLISAERPKSSWYAGGAGAMPVAAPELGLAKGWQQRLLSAVGNYRDIFERNLGRGSRLKMPRGLNANQIFGGLLLSPFLE